MTGPSYPTSEALYHALGGKAFGLTPMQIFYEGRSHWYLRWDVPVWFGKVTKTSTFYLDPTSTQFKTPVPYAEGKGRGFLTKVPSERAKKLLNGTLRIDNDMLAQAMTKGLS